MIKKSAAIKIALKSKYFKENFISPHIQFILNPAIVFKISLNSSFQFVFANQNIFIPNSDVIITSNNTLLLICVSS